jgi:hypothetical protein
MDPNQAGTPSASVEEVDVDIGFQVCLRLVEVSLKIELASGACSIGSLGGCKMMRARRKYKLDVRDPAS